MEPKGSPILEARGLTVVYPGTIALNQVDFSLAAGEIHAIVGENGAGKSTLVKSFAGIVTPTAGEIRHRDQTVNWRSPRQAIEAGIATIYQEPALFPQLTVTENIFAAAKRTSRVTRTLLWKRMRSDAEALLSDLGIAELIRPSSRIAELSIAQRQLVEIAKALAVDASIVIMDEPTSSLSQRETEHLFRLVRALQARGVSIIIISHKPDEILEISDRVSVYRDGHYVATRETATVSDTEIIRMMVGRNIEQLYPKTATDIGEEALTVEHLSRRGYFHEISFTVHQGEIVGLSGLVGSGRTEVAESLFGISPHESGTVRVRGKPVTIKRPSDAIRLGIGFVTENRGTNGLFLELSLVENLCALVLKKTSNGPFLNKNLMRSVSADQASKFDVRASSLAQTAKFLSGGNQQKVVLAKWLAQSLRILIVDEPTKGIDVATKARIHGLLSTLASSGVAILMISSELPEVLGMSDRILVMRKGKIVGTYTKEQADPEKIMMAATGVAKERVSS